MKEVNGKPSNFNIFDLTKVSDLIEFDGPLLSHFINDKNEDFLFLWCDVDQAYNRWVIFKVENFTENLFKRRYYYYFRRREYG